MRSESRLGSIVRSTLVGSGSFGSRSDSMTSIPAFGEIGQESFQLVGARSWSSKRDDIVVGQRTLVAPFPEQGSHDGVTAAIALGGCGAISLSSGGGRAPYERL